MSEGCCYITTSGLHTVRIIQWTVSTMRGVISLPHPCRYTKALSRRARAAEQTGDLMQCLEDTTAVCILESFENQQSLLMADRVLKVLGRTKAKENYKVSFHTQATHNILSSCRTTPGKRLSTFSGLINLTLLVLTSSRNT